VTVWAWSSNDPQAYAASRRSAGGCENRCLAKARLGPQARRSGVVDRSDKYGPGHWMNQQLTATTYGLMVVSRRKLRGRLPVFFLVNQTIFD